ncbi:hypothetical protein K504DRAFT_435539 [Pleomassaria siparia CBS 279.74]|uniref:Dpy-30 domain-containing protein n=1 Tax=Pleomassaria siparia CBS 279.74 TaxID=1314801 RepID=A0A6G1K468_9PLEO|nr:hypothetical protein K504DRAFT_435539 [Pleomassaria siparia CBS 279.74]
MADQAPVPPPQITEASPSGAPSPMPIADTVQNGTSVDVEMKDEPVVEQPTLQPFSVPTPSPAYAPEKQTSTRNSPHPTAAPQPPIHPNPHGSPTRVYLNQNVTPHLLEAMKHLVTTEPDKPLKWLSEFLAQKSLEIEGP